MAALKNIIKKINKLQTSEKIKLVVSFLLTVAVLIAVPVLAWFSNQRRIATMAKINSPAKLSIRSGFYEDIIHFQMSGINVGDGTAAGSQSFVFCVEGEDIANYNIQIAHTTNINFTYTLFKAHSNSQGEVVYVDENGIEHRYSKAEIFGADPTKPAYGGYINGETIDGRLVANSNYTEQSYDSADYNNHIQKYAEPLYWQTLTAINAFDEDESHVSYNEYNTFHPDAPSDRKFLNFYILEVSWGIGTFPNGNDKETDLIYITAEVDG